MKPVAWIDEETGCFVYSQYDYEDLDEHGKDGLIPLYTHPVKEQELLDEVTKLKWEINHREQDIDALKTKLNDVKYKYDIKTHQHIYTQVYVDELQAEIETLKAHPVKELTDEEIHDLMDEIRNAVGDDIERAMYRMARAILRKAQEK